MTEVGDSPASRTLLDQLPVVTYRRRHDHDWSLVEVAGPVERLTGHAPTALTASAPTLGSLVIAADRARVDGELARALEGRAPFELLYRITHADGEPRWVRDEGRGLCSDTGEVESLVGVLSDVTDRRRGDARALQQQKLEAVGRLAGGMAHDINNYLAAIRAQCELVRMKRASDQRVAQKMDSVIRTVGKAANLIDRLLAFSRRQPRHPQVISINRAVADVEAMMRRLLPESVTLDVRLGADAGNVRVDRAQLEQVLVNLLVNARDAMPRGGSISVATSRAAAQPGDEDAECVVLTVADSGPGVAAEIRDDVFDPFFTTKQAAGGTGLGLATVHGIVTQSGGNIDLLSPPGGGATFRIALPACSEEESPGAFTTTGVKSVAGGTEHVLLVEDNATLRGATRSLLRSYGYRVTTAANADEALAAMAGLDDVALVIADVLLGGMSGPELVARLRARHPLRSLYLSGYTDSVALLHGVDSGTECYLSKPFSAAELATKVREALDR